MKKAKPRVITAQDWDAWLGYLLPPPAVPSRPASQLTRELAGAIKTLYDADYWRAGQGVVFYGR